MLRMAREERRFGDGVCGCNLSFHWSAEHTIILRTNLFLVCTFSHCLNNVSSPVALNRIHKKLGLKTYWKPFHQNPGKKELGHGSIRRKENIFCIGEKVCAGFHGELYSVPHFKSLGFFRLNGTLHFFQIQGVPVAQLLTYMLSPVCLPATQQVFFWVLYAV